MWGTIKIWMVFFLPWRRERMVKGGINIEIR